MSTQYEIFNHFGVSKRKDLVQSKTYEQTRDVILAALKDRSWIAFSGPIKSGKTATISHIVRDRYRQTDKLEVVHITNPKAGSISVSNVMNMIIYTLGEKYGFGSTKPRDLAVKGARVNNILSKIKMDKKEVLIVIDEAHELDVNAIKSLKRLRNFRFMDDDDLCTILLIGQPSLDSKIGRDDEVKERCAVTPFGYSTAEKVQIATHHSYGMLDEAQAQRVAEAFGQPKSIEAAIYAAMQRAYRIGSAELKMKFFDWPEEPEERDAPDRKKVSVGAGDADEVDATLKNAS